MNSACAVGICKTIIISKRADITHNRAYLDLWNQIEGNVIMIAATIPTLLPLIRTVKRCWPGCVRASTSTLSSPAPEFLPRKSGSPYEAPTTMSSASTDGKPAHEAKMCTRHPDHKHAEFQFGPGYGGVEFVLHSRPSMEADVEAGRAIQRTQDITVSEETYENSAAGARKRSLVELGLGELEDLEKGWRPVLDLGYENHREHE